MAILGTIIATAIVTVLVMNFMTGEKKIKERIEPLYAVSDPQFLRSMGTLLGPSIKGENQIDSLLNGEEIFPAMLKEIRSAGKTISFETYIYWSGRIGKEFADALSERARAGVKVHVLLDWVGSGKIDKALLKEMLDGGVHVQRYHPLRWYNVSRMNNRTHRKLLIVDGKVGFTGGVGIADEWLGHAQDDKHWRDSHFPRGSVGEMGPRSWTTGKTEGRCSTERTTSRRSQPPHCSPRSHEFPAECSESARLMYLSSIASARKNCASKVLSAR